MRRIRIIAALLGGLLLTLGACAGPSTTATTTLSPVSVPASTTPATAEVAVAPEPACPLPAPELGPGQLEFVPDPINYLVEVTPAPGQPGYRISQMRIYPFEAEVGQNVTISVVVANTGVYPGNYTVVLKFDGEVIQTQDITIDGGGSTKVEFNFPGVIILPSLPFLMPEYDEFKVVAGEFINGFKVFF